MIICSQCGVTVEAGEQFCSECGFRVVYFNRSPPPTVAVSAEPSAQVQIDQQTYSASSLANPPVPSKPTNPIVWVAIPFGLLVVVVLTVIGFSSSNSNNNSASVSTTSNSSSRPNSNPGLPASFQHNYQGTIGSKNSMSFSVALTRSGRDLKGTASSGRKSDTLSGTIETDGRFRLEGYENGNSLTGIYTGQIFTDGTITGSWVTATGQKETPFFLRQQ